MAVIEGDVIRATMWGSFLNAGRWQNVWHAIITNIVSPPVPDANVTASIMTVLENFYAQFYVDMSAQVRFDYLECYNVTQDQPMNTQIVNTAMNGTRDPGQLTSHSQSMLVAFPTATKQTVGKKHIPGISESDSDNGLLTAGALTHAVNAGLLMLGPKNGNGSPVPFRMTFGCCSYPAHAFSPFTSARSSNVPGQQRRRRPSIGI